MAILEARRRFGRFIALAAAFVGLLAGSLRAAPVESPEALVKTAFIYNFAKFTEWPASAFASPQAPLVLCLLGDGPPLQALDGKSVQAHALQVRRGIRLADAGGCHMLFVAESEARRLTEVLHAVAAQNVLTISDIDDFADAGGVIGLFLMDNKVQFEINVDAANRANLRISSQLLKLARIVRERRKG